MTYLAKRRVIRHRRPALSGPLEDFTNKLVGQSSAEQQCVDQANLTEAAFDAKVDDLVQNWQPTGFYAPADIRSLVSATMSLVQQAQAVVDQAAATANAGQDSLLRATDDLARAGSRSLDYLAAATQADQQGNTVVNAPGLKTWVTNTMGTCGSAVVTANAIGCLQPWWVAALAAFQSGFDLAWSAVKGIAGVLASVGVGVLQVAADLSESMVYVKYAALALAGLWLWSKYR